jgi:hypothetical protein
MIDPRWFQWVMRRAEMRDHLYLMNRIFTGESWADIFLSWSPEKQGRLMASLERVHNDMLGLQRGTSNGKKETP